MEGGESPPGQAGDPAIGGALKQFRILAKLGEGGMGVVYRAMDETLRREVALKVLPESLAGDEERRRRFLREARSAAAVTHPNIATVYEIGEADGHVFIAMELIAGHTLRELIALGMTRAEAFRVAKEIARGLARAHEKGVVHRDLKPENVMVTTEGEVKILDFGLAKMREADPADGGADSGRLGSQMTIEGRIMGTPGYMSPEQALGRSDVGAPSDIFSFGIMLYEMLAGVRPFQGTSNIAVLYAVMHLAAPPLEEVCPDAALLPPELIEAVARCLRKAPSERFATGRELTVALGVESASRPSDAMSRRAPAVEKLSSISGMGTALAPTIASGSLDRAPSTLTNALTPKGHAPTRAAGPWLIGLGALLVLGAAAVATAKLGRPVEVATPSPSASGSPVASVVDAGPKRGVEMTAHPLPTSTSPAAAMHYASARQRLRVGAIGSFVELEKATELDPTMAAAQLRLVLYAPLFTHLSGPERRARAAKTQLVASSLEPRDAALLPVAEALAEDPPNFGAASARVKQLLERSPDDAELAFLELMYVTKGGRPKDAKAAARRVLELDPLATQVLAFQATQAERQAEGDDEAEALATRCLELAPSATACSRVKADLAAEAGKCDAELAIARDMVKQDPDDRHPYSLLAQALDALDTARTKGEAVRSALDQAASRRVETDPKEPAGLEKIVLAAAQGDFAAADAAALAVTPELAGSSSERDHAELAALRIALAEEQGTRGKALEIAIAHGRQAGGWTEDAPLEVRMKRIYLAHEAGNLTDAAFTAQRERRFEEAFRARASSSQGGEERLRLLIDAEYAETPAEAAAALARHESLAPTPAELREHAFAFGRLAFLGGRVDEAIPMLERVTRSCHSLPDALSLGAVRLVTPLTYVQAHLVLGEALAQKGDKAGACKAFAVVQTRWKGAKPRSVSLEKANEHARALGCSASRP